MKASSSPLIFKRHKLEVIDANHSEHLPYGIPVHLILWLRQKYYAISPWLIPFLVKLTRWFISAKVFINQLKVVHQARKHCQTNRFVHQLVKFWGIGYWRCWPMKRKGDLTGNPLHCSPLCLLRCPRGINGDRSNGGQRASPLFVDLFLWLSYKFFLVCSSRTLVIVSRWCFFYIIAAMISCKDSSSILTCILLKHQWVMNCVDA